MLEEKVDTQTVRNVPHCAEIYDKTVLARNIEKSIRIKQASIKFTVTK